MIRPAIPQDHAFISGLAQAFNRFGPYVPVFEAMLDGNHAALERLGVRGDVELFIYEQNPGQPVGFAAVEWQNGVCHIHGVAVRDEFKRQGVATKLLDKIAQLARERGIETLECITAQTANAPALQCFTRWGFQNMGIVGNYPQGQAAVRLRHTLGQIPAAAGRA